MRTWLLWLVPLLAWGQGSDKMVSYSAKSDFPLKADPSSAPWKDIKGVVTETGRFGEPVPNGRTEIRSVWTKKNLYFLFISNFETQYLKPNPSRTEETWGIWDYDVVEVFIGHDLKNINLYKEFEVTPQSEWVDLDVDKAKKGQFVDWKWNSHFKLENKVDQSKKIWYSVMAIPWESIAAQPAAAGQQFRLNLYRIEGQGNRKYIAWRPIQNNSYHTPEKFGLLQLSGAKK